MPDVTLEIALICFPFTSSPSLTSAWGMPKLG